MDWLLGQVYCFYVNVVTCVHCLPVGSSVYLSIRLSFCLMSLFVRCYAHITSTAIKSYKKIYKAIKRYKKLKKYYHFVVVISRYAVVRCG